MPEVKVILLTFVQGDSRFWQFHIFSSGATKPIEAKFHMEPL